MQLQTKVIRGFGWTAAEKIGSALFQIVVSIVVINRIVPDDTMMVAIIAAIIAVLNTFVDSGFSQTLIRRLDATERDFSSVFFFNMAVAVALYVALVACSGAIARLYGVEMLKNIGPVMFLLIPLNALCIIQQTILFKEFKFRRTSSINLGANISGGVAAVCLAVAGAGVWALVGQRLTTLVVKAVVLWFSTGWRPRIGEFSWKIIAGMYRFSSKLFATDLINNTYNNLPTLFMGKLFQGDLGFYNQAQKLKDTPVVALTNTVNSVGLPALSNLTDEKYTDGLRKLTQMLSFAIFPVMTGLIATADDIFALLIKPIWHPAVPLFKVLCLMGLFSPLAVLFNNSMKARSNGNVIVRIEVIKKIVVTLILAATIPLGAKVIAWGQVAVALFDMCINFGANQRYSGYRWSALAGDILPVAALCGGMFAAVEGVDLMLCDIGVGIRLTAKIATGIAVYAAGAWACQLRQWQELLGVINMRKK
ncbi:MAG: lipopolysaccharide biosynthesis protein [Rikenellaceae bacterium]|nr:lipopolysaccharide biosynthesis protein [Rikenellaceae bacterium]